MMVVSESISKAVNPDFNCLQIELFMAQQKLLFSLNEAELVVQKKKNSGGHSVFHRERNLIVSTTRPLQGEDT